MDQSEKLLNGNSRQDRGNVRRATEEERVTFLHETPAGVCGEGWGGGV